MPGCEKVPGFPTQPIYAGYQATMIGPSAKKARSCEMDSPNSPVMKRELATILNYIEVEELEKILKTMADLLKTKHKDGKDEIITAILLTTNSSDDLLREIRKKYLSRYIKERKLSVIKGTKHVEENVIKEYWESICANENTKAENTLDKMTKSELVEMVKEMRPIIQKLSELADKKKAQTDEEQELIKKLQTLAVNEGSSQTGNIPISQKDLPEKGNEGSKTIVKEEK